MFIVSSIVCELFCVSRERLNAIKCMTGHEYDYVPGECMTEDAFQMNELLLTMSRNMFWVNA